MEQAIGKPTIRYSKKREAILQLIESVDTHPSAEWLFQKLKPDYPDLSLGTVYRNLAFFQEQGQIISVGNVKGQERYDATVHPHSHFICEECGAVSDLFDISLDSSIKAQVANDYGFAVARHELHLYGTCDKCLKPPSKILS